MAEKQNHPKQTEQQQSGVPKTESSSEYEGAESRKPSANPPVSVKPESSSEYEGAEPRKPQPDSMTPPAKNSKNKGSSESGQ